MKEGEKAKIHAEVPVQPEFVPRKAEFLELSCRCYMPKKSLKVTLSVLTAACQVFSFASMELSDKHLI